MVVQFAYSNHVNPVLQNSPVALGNLSFLISAQGHSETTLDVKETKEFILPLSFSKSSSVYDCNNHIVLNLLVL